MPVDFSATNAESGDIDARGKNMMVTALFVRGTEILQVGELVGGSVSATNAVSGDIGARGRNMMVTALFVRGTEIATAKSEQAAR